MERSGTDLHPALPRVMRALTKWAVTETRVRSLTIFGSFYRGNNSIPSEIDVAIETKRPPGDASQDGLATYICDKEEMVAVLQSDLPLPLDLQLMTPRIQEWIEDQGGRVTVPLFSSMA